MRRRTRFAALIAACALFAFPAGARAFDLGAELLNFTKITERERYITLTPGFLSLLVAQTSKGPGETIERLVNDPERVPANICGARMFECAGDVRFYEWPDHSDGIRKSVLFTARSGATLSGHIWATRSGPAKRPGIVITTGSVQAPEELYWGEAATLAKHGFVVLTYDVQGQGLSDTRGEGGDADEGVPSQAGEPFYDGTEDGLDFLLSNSANPYEPRPSCTTGTSHAAKQNRRVAEGHNEAYNPLGDLVDPSRIGIAGHSLGAGAVSYVGQEDPRVDAIVAWDNLGRADEGAAAAGGALNIPPCASAPNTRTPRPLAKPAMGISNDYGIVPTPNLADPDPQGKNRAFLAYRDAGVDSAEISIRGGCHEESAFVPGSFTGPYPIGCGTLRGQDLVAWYTTAWFDKYVKGDPGADARVLTNRWRNDGPEAAIDPNQDGNAFSFYFRSRYDIGLAGGGSAICDDMRAGCAGMAADGLPANYSMVDDAYAPASPPAGAAALSAVAGAKSTVNAKLKKALKKCARKKNAKVRRRCIRRATRKFASAVRSF